MRAVTLHSFAELLLLKIYANQNEGGENIKQKSAFVHNKKEYSKKIIALMSPYFVPHIFSLSLSQLGFETILFLVIFKCFDLNCDTNSLKCENVFKQ